MDIIEEMRQQKAVYWAPTGTDQFNRRTYEAPVEIDCRWVDKRVVYHDKEGREKVSMAVVYVDRVLDIEGGVLWEGELANITSQAPFENDGAYEIRAFNKTPTLDNDAVLLEVLL